MKKPVDEVTQIIRMNLIFRAHGLPSVPLRGPKFYPKLVTNIVALSLLIQEMAGEGEGEEA